MKKEKIIMGMTVRVEIVDKNISEEIFDKVFDYFKWVDQKFSTYKSDSEISKINAGQIKKGGFSKEMQEIFVLAQKTKEDTKGYFDIKTRDNSIDPSGIVKGWAIKNAAQTLRKNGYKNFYVEAGGDVETSGKNSLDQLWSVGIRNPFKAAEVIKIISVGNSGVATSGNYVRGAHIYNPRDFTEDLNELASLTVVGPNIYEADRFATAAFAMGRNGIYFIENLPGLEGYMIDRHGLATMTTGFEKYLE